MSLPLSQQTADQAVYSTFGTDPDLSELVTMFVESMPERIDSLQQEFENENWDLLRRSAHQLKGSAGGYGFDQITPLATQLEMAVSQGRSNDEILTSLRELVDLCRRVRDGGPQ
jgi:HPt (histidine-containing phosphotransfer) domain-containing protein